MKCPFCGEENTKVIDSRPADDNASIRRRRKCEKCSKRFTTYEKLETIPLDVIKKDEVRTFYCNFLKIYLYQDQITSYLTYMT